MRKGAKTMAAKLTPENVRIMLAKQLDEVSYWECEGKDAEKQLCYIAGLTDMANAVIKAIKDGERKKA